MEVLPQDEALVSPSKRKSCEKLPYPFPQDLPHFFCPPVPLSLAAGRVPPDILTLLQVLLVVPGLLFLALKLLHPVGAQHLAPAARGGEQHPRTGRPRRSLQNRGAGPEAAMEAGGRDGGRRQGWRMEARMRPRCPGREGVARRGSRLLVAVPAPPAPGGGFLQPPGPGEAPGGGGLHGDVAAGPGGHGLHGAGGCTKEGRGPGAARQILSPQLGGDL